MNLKTRSCLFICIYQLFLIFCLSDPVYSQNQYLSIGPKIDKIVAPYVSAADFMGVVAIQQDNEEPLVLPYGMASVELEIPHKTTDIFMIGSISKQFTAAAILLLEEDGLLSTSDPVKKHLPGFTQGENITIEQLITHTSGVTDIYSLKRFGESAGQGGTFAEVIADLSGLEPTFRPGSSYAYSNGGYSVLAAIIEEIQGTTYGNFLNDRIFQPLNLTNTSHDNPQPVVNGRVPGYDPWGIDQLTPVKSLSVAFSTGSGSLWSTATDLLKWNIALHNGRLLNEKSYQKLIKDYGNAYGYGVSIFKRFGRDVVGHDGRVAGYAGDIARYLDDRITIVILSNVQSVARDEIRYLVAAATLGESYTVPQHRTYSKLPATTITDFIGTYSFGPGFRVTINESNGRLMARANEGGQSELITLNESEWFSRMLYATVRFGRDQEGKVDRLIWGRGDRAPVGQRIKE